MAKIDVSKVKLVIAAAGKGTRMLPATAFIPKEFLPVPIEGFAIPVILAQVLNAMEAGILFDNIRIVISDDKREAFEKAFNGPHDDLIAELEKSGKVEFATALKRIPKLTSRTLVLQDGPYGNGTPLLNSVSRVISHAARNLANDIIQNEQAGSPINIVKLYENYKSSLTVNFIEPDDWVFYSYADDLFLGDDSDFKQMIAAAEKYDCSIFAAKRVEKDSDYDRFGIVAGDIISGTSGKAINVKKIVEKPGAENAPSDFASVSSYLFAPKPAWLDNYLTIIDAIKAEYTHHSEDSGEFMIQPAIQAMIDNNPAPEGNIIALKLNGEYHDTGNPEAFAKIWRTIAR